MFAPASAPPPAAAPMSMPASSAANATAAQHSHDLAAVYSTYVVRVHTRHGIKTISFDLLAAFFTCTAKKAAEDLGISSRTLIRVCRSLGIRRWPYLGFRSEKNVERIRHEAIENLRRKLEKDGGLEAAAPGMHAPASCLRGASAKRLLQVKLPPVSVSVAVPLGMPMPAARHLPRFSRMPGAASVSGSSPPLLTPPSAQAHAGFRASISPKCTLPPLQPPTMRPTFEHPRKAVPSSSPEPMSVDSEGPMPALNVLVDASILTAFKHEMETKVAQDQAQAEAHAHHARTMSMRDILAHSTRA